MRRLVVCLLPTLWLVCLALGQTVSSDHSNVKAAVAPVYPPLAVAARVSGEVTVQVLIDSSGRVAKNGIIQGHPLLKAAAAEAAQKWQFDTSSLQQRVAVLVFQFALFPTEAKMESQITFLPPYSVKVERRPMPPLDTYGNPSGH